MFDVLFEWRRPYRWRTNLRALLPRPLCWIVKKANNCEDMGADHDWYNVDNETSGCYHCREVRRGQLWKTNCPQ